MSPSARRKIQRGSRWVRGVSAGASGPRSHSTACRRRFSMSLPADYIFMMRGPAVRVSERRSLSYLRAAAILEYGNDKVSCELSEGVIFQPIFLIAVCRLLFVILPNQGH